MQIKGVVRFVLEENPYLEFYYRDINLVTGEVRTINRNGKRKTPYKYADYKGLEFRIYDSGSIYVMGSLHKYWNDGEHNYNDLTKEMFFAVVQDLEKRFDIDPKLCILKNLEIGVNIIPPIPVNTVLDHCFLHKTNPLCYTHNTDEGKYRQVKYEQYIIKIYNKSLQYGIDKEILRFEIKYTRMQKIHREKIFTLKDLVNYGFKNFTNILIKEWENILFYDSSIIHNTVRLANYRNPLYWLDLLENRSSSTFKKHRKVLRWLTKNYSQNYKQKILETIKCKINDLAMGCPNLQLVYNVIKDTPKRLIFSETKKYCFVTGLDISMQKNDSITLSHTGLRYYRKYYPKLYTKVKEKYLTRRWSNSSSEEEIREIAHHIRDIKRNYIRSRNNKYKKGQLNMFGVLGIRPLSLASVKGVEFM
ncbi:hypothetical protein D1816_23020 [Aquimarina sp. AD10]|nr:hypothetical protein D1816_23020 [Aquimarina sp. AD10]RKM98688.1 hypothetical protein D7033_12185 [Aquimarina sp. AD10]